LLPSYVNCRSAGNVPPPILRQSLDFIEGFHWPGICLVSSQATDVHIESSATIDRTRPSTPGLHIGTPRDARVAARSAVAPVVLIASAVAGLRRFWRESVQRFAAAEVSDHGQLERILSERTPAVLLLDLQLPHLGGFEGVAALHRLQPATKIVVLTSPVDDREGLVALKSGARGYCDRGISPALLTKALHAVQNGEVWVGRRLISHLLEELSALCGPELVPDPVKDAPVAIAARLDLLTPRERTILDLLGAGASNKDIAQKLGVTERTVKAHLTAVFRKLGISGRLQAAIIAAEHSRAAVAADVVRQRVG